MLAFAAQDDQVAARPGPEPTSVSPSLSPLWKSYVSVLTLSSHALHERLSPAQLGGVALIFLGVFFISRTPSATSAPP